MYNCCIVFSALGRREPEPITDIAAESGDDEQTQNNMTKVTDDPIVKMLVEEKDDDIQTDVTK